MIDFAKVDFGEEEKEAVNRVLKTDWLASGPENELFEKEFASYVNSDYAISANSGSSANLLALASLELKKGAKVLTSACGFPATYSPCLHLGHEPVLADYDMVTHNIDLNQVYEKLTQVGAIILAHTMGNPVELRALVEEAKYLGVKVIEDCCEAVGSKLDNKFLGTYGDLGTYSFYPAHQITALGGGGMVVTNNETLYRRMKSLRDWGKMYDWDSSKGGNQTDYSSPIGYHRGYTYETVGWNFKLPEANCAFGREQLKKLERFKTERIGNWKYLEWKLENIPQIKIAPMADGACPFGFCMSVKDRNKFGLYLESKGIKHRPFFAGNILRQPAFKSDLADNFPVADKLMNEALFIGCHTKMTLEDLEYISDTIHAYFSNT